MPTNEWFRSLHESIHTPPKTHIQCQVIVRDSAVFPYIDTGSNFTLVSTMAMKRLGLLDALKTSRIVSIPGVS